MLIINLLLQNLTTLSLLFGLGIIMLSNKDFDKKTNISFMLLICCIIILTVSDIIDSYSGTLPHPIFLNYIVSTLGYTLRPTTISIIISILLRRKRNHLFFYVPIMIVAFISSTSYFTHLMYWYDINNYFMRGPLTYISHIVSGAYMIVLIILIIKMHNYITPSEVFATLFSCFICIVATYLETVLADCNYLLTGAMAISCTLYYVVLYAETYRRDHLTGLMNRKSLFLNIKKFQKKPFTIISIDMNGLKDINDNYGHNAGDKALKCLANILISESNHKFIAHRVGGDEFTILIKGQDIAEVKNYFDSVRKKLKEQNLMASFGYSFYTCGDNIDKILNEADASMYEDKKRYKHRSTCVN